MSNILRKMTKSVQQKYLQAIVFLVSCCSTALSCHGTLRASGITADEKKIILQEHNKLRQLVATGGFPGQPAAENMQEIVWDDELAARAQEWANNCEFRHDPNRTIKRFTMGQNLAVIWSTAPLEPDDGDFPSRINNWFNEVQKYSFGASWSPKTGHYSQLVWGETNLIGCGYSEYKDRAKYNKLYVCNYGPGGNVVGYNPYEIGKPSCKNYGMDPSPRYRGLCMDPTLTPLGEEFFKKIETYEYKQNTFNTKTSFTSSRSNNQQPQQAEIQQQQPAIPEKQPSSIPAILSSFFQHEPVQPKIVPTNSQLQQETQSHLPFIKNPISDQSILKAILSPTSHSSEERTSQLQQKPHQQIENKQQPSQLKQEEPQYQHQQHQLPQQQQLQDEAPDTNLNEIMSRTPKARWSLLTWRG
ncbi:cysteine-rich secretory protein LCCL domain-containing 2 [Episyrphus balteatus]|uniref:cysteine-rich secretory protein LCCL domain-containing 2 n=1 Tax=Episyrphus balteatus TaxID=286459 RepID=UPI0024866D01|nr:cysteine-rich secretory protein LCCL domain-containing 2 [Episyrphus balteatus]